MKTAKETAAKPQQQETPVKWSAKMQRAFAEAECGKLYSRNISELLNV